MASLTLDGKRFVVYEVTRTGYKAKGYYPTSHLRVLELNHEVLFKRMLTGQLTLTRVNDPVVKRVVNEWKYVNECSYVYTLTKALEICRQLNERNQDD